jgi:6-pyruvoyltetrahydropterin/6-carboxytetrahydropterin synthase
LRGYRGKCESLHGHNWKVKAVILSHTLDKTGMVVDFNKAKSYLNNVLAELDHRDLNRLATFKYKNPTSEILAEYIFNRYEKKLKEPLKLKSITVWETPTSSATFYSD